MNDFNIDDYERTPLMSGGGCTGCVTNNSTQLCYNLETAFCGFDYIFKLKEQKPTRESLLAEIAELDRQKEIKERELRELSNKEQGYE